MGTDIPASDIGYKVLEAILLPIEDDAGFGSMLGAAILLGAEEHAEFQWLLNRGRGGSPSVSVREMS